MTRALSCLADWLVVGFVLLVLRLPLTVCVVAPFCLAFLVGLLLTFN